MEQEADDGAIWELRLDAGRQLPDAIGDKVQEFIERGVYKPGGRLPTESELARKMKVARSSVRTGLQRLEPLGLVEVRRGLGWYVRRAVPAERTPLTELFSNRRYRPSDLFELRIALEGLAASLAAVRAKEGEVEDIAKLNKLHAEAGDDPVALLDTDIAFHGAIFRAARNQLLLETYEGLIPEFEEWRRESYADRGVPARSAREHAKVVRYLTNRDPGGARAAMGSHLERLYDEIVDIDAEPLDLTHDSLDAEPDWHTGEHRSTR